MKLKYFILFLILTFLWSTPLIPQEKSETQEVKALKNEAITLINNMKARIDRIQTSWQLVRGNVSNIQRDLSLSTYTANQLKTLITTLAGINEEYEGLFRESLAYSNIRENLKLREEEVPPFSAGDHWGPVDPGDSLTSGYSTVKPEMYELEERMLAAGLIEARNECEAYTFTSDCTGDLNKCTQCCGIKYPNADQIYQKQWCLAICLMRSNQCLSMAAIRNLLG